MVATQHTHACTCQLQSSRHNLMPTLPPLHAPTLSSPLVDATFLASASSFAQTPKALSARPNETPYARPRSSCRLLPHPYLTTNTKLLPALGGPRPTLASRPTPHELSLPKFSCTSMRVARLALLALGASEVRREHRTRRTLSNRFLKSCLLSQVALPACLRVWMRRVWKDALPRLVASAQASSSHNSR